MILAAIDVGTNSVKLLVARVERSRVRPLLQKVVITRLGEGLGKRSTISHVAALRTLDTLAEFKRLAEEKGAERIAVVGTRALRAARNARNFVLRCRSELGETLSVLSEKEEARLAFMGSLSAGTRRTALVVDIGGGSVQMTLGTRRGPEWYSSAPLGAVVLTERHLHHDPPDPMELIELRADILARLEPHLVRFAAQAKRSTLTQARLVGVGGTVATLAAIDARLRHVEPDRIHGRTLTAERVLQWVHRLEVMSAEDRLRVPGMQPGREDIIIAGAYVLSEIIPSFGAQTVVVSAAGLRHGLVLEMAAGRWR